MKISIKGAVYLAIGVGMLIAAFLMHQHAGGSLGGRRFPIGAGFAFLLFIMGAGFTYSGITGLLRRPSGG